MKHLQKLSLVVAGTLAAVGSALAQGGSDAVSAATTALSAAQTGATTTGSNIPAIVGAIILVGVVVAMMRKA